MSGATKVIKQLAGLRVGGDSSEKTTSAPAQISRCPLAIRDGRHVVSKPTIALLQAIGGRDKLLAVTRRFYAKVFRDKQLSKFFEDITDPHQERLADWIAEKMSGEAYWSATLNDRPLDQPFDRSSAHAKAWHCSKREPSRFGQHFKLDDSVMWMRLMFWAVREEGLTTEPFFTWYKSFIAHFVRVYERSAPPYAEAAARWSADPANLAEYEANGWLMKDILHLR